MASNYVPAIADGTLRNGKAIADGGRAKWIGFMTYCLVRHLQGSISLACVLMAEKIQNKSWEMYAFPSPRGITLGSHHANII